MFKTLLKFISGAMLWLAVGVQPSQAQDMIRQQSCDISGYTSAIDSIKQYYGERGFSLLREASMTMESEYEMPIIMPMTQGTWYQFVFIGDPSSRLYEVRMYDYNEKEVIFKQNRWGDVDGNIINFDYVPRFSEMHMIKPVQVNKKKKKLCGYVMLFKRTAPPGTEKK
ncbi:hypothetical protein [Pseudoflavitalea rhizosphaerae]|uniref:hypothetical protein n=1 Tax=Pseudoflavitalea rhizosphaerae TaxID=1884793 RepID=UPI000F8E3BDF|nr:hypothetical protein [Pseudoflavitalea rhizosphaerae]